MGRNNYRSKGQSTSLADSITLLYPNLPGDFGSQKADFGVLFSHTVLYEMGRQFRWGEERSHGNRIFQTGFQKDLRFALYHAAHRYLPGVGTGDIQVDLVEMSRSVLQINTSGLIELTAQNTPEERLASFIGSVDERVIINQGYQLIGNTIIAAMKKSKAGERSKKNFLEYRDLDSALEKLTREFYDPS